jgi:molecular chaperone HtpG
MQDSALVQKINKILTGRYLKDIANLADKDPEAFKAFYAQFGIYFKEGITSDFTHKDKLSPLIRYESSLTEKDAMTSLAEYVSRMPEEQKEIYYLFAPSRESIETGPYLEAFKARQMEVLFHYEPVDEFVMNHLHEVDGKKLVSADSADIQVDNLSTDALPEAEQTALTDWLKESLGSNVTEVGVSKRLTDSPAIALNADKMMTPSMRRIMKAMQQETGETTVRLEINPAHPLILKLNSLKTENPELAKLMGRQILDNCLISAGFVDDPRSMVNRIYSLLEKLG